METASQIKSRQLALQKAGFYHGKVDGLDGPLTKRAEAEYKKSLTSSVEAQLLNNGEWRTYEPVEVKWLASVLPPQARHLAAAFCDSGKKHGIDVLFLVALSKHETGNWTSSAFRNKNNAMGISTSTGVRTMASHAASIEHMAKALVSPTGYYRKCVTLHDVWMVYSPPSFKQKNGKPVANDPFNYNRFWGPTVARYWSEYLAKV